MVKCTCNQSHARGHTHNAHRGRNPLRLDPTRSITLRKSFIREFNRRFNRLKADIRGIVDMEDAFGLRDRVHTFRNEAVTNKRFEFQTTSEQVRSFEAWLATRIDDVILDGGADPAEGYWRAFTEEGYRKGAGRSFNDVRGTAGTAGITEAGFAEGAAEAFISGSKNEFLRSAFANPETTDKLKTLAGRTFTDLKGVSSQMSSQISRILVDGLSRGDNPKVIARRLTDAVDGIGKVRAKMIAQTEIIRAHAEGQLDSLESLGLEKVTVMVEWSTAGDDRVCFPADTLVETDHGSVPIQSIEEGVMVKTRGGFQKVVETASREYTGTMTQIQTRLGPTHCTADHPFWEATEGWTEAGSLTDEGVLLSSDGTEVSIDSVMGFAFNKSITVYDIQVDVEPEFYANGLLVHNCPLCEALDGIVMKIQEARGLIPRHPSCRCSFTPANVGEAVRPGSRDQKSVEQAIDDSVRAEMPKGRMVGGKRRFKDPATGLYTRKRPTRTLKEQKRKTTWMGADRRIAKKRPAAFTTEPEGPARVRPVDKKPIAPKQPKLKPRGKQPELTDLGMQGGEKFTTSPDKPVSRKAEKIPKRPKPKRKATPQRAKPTKAAPARKPEEKKIPPAKKTPLTPKADVKSRQAAEDYTTDSFQKINKGLRDGKIVDKRIVAGTDKYLKDAPKFKGDTVRSFNVTAKEKQEILGQLKKGKIADKAFVSTAKVPTLTDKIALETGNMPADRIVFRMKGKSGADISDISLNPAEGEVLFGRNTQFRVTGFTETKSGGIIADLEEIVK